MAIAALAITNNQQSAGKIKLPLQTPHKNDGRGGGQILTKESSDGTPITYREYDVNPVIKDVNRGAERIVRGSDGKSYYTPDHYKTFTEIK